MGLEQQPHIDSIDLLGVIPLSSGATPLTTKKLVGAIHLRRTTPLAKKNWSGREDLNFRPLEPHSSALPDCATPRHKKHLLTC
jgi:hypothetical protein